MSDSVTKTLFSEFVDERLEQYDRLFSGNLWKKSLLPFLKSSRELAIIRLLASRDHTETDMQKGFILALDNVINLPKYVENALKAKTDPESAHNPENYPSPITAAFDEYQPMFDEDSA